MYDSVRERISEGIRYVNELNWTLTFVRGTGEKPKMPLFTGWPSLRHTAEQVRAILEFHADAGIGVNLGASSLIDLEGDSPEGEAVLDDLCRDFEFPCWQSKKSKHRLFQAHPSVGYLRIAKTEIEFRTGAHQSVLPPSVIGDTQYRWLVSPFEVKPPPLPDRIMAFYSEQHRNPANEKHAVREPHVRQRWPYRDHFDYMLRRFDLRAEAARAGLTFVTDVPDANGNIPCYVPAALRGGNSDERPSGVFNVFNGVLRDFATERNHAFFRVMGALTGRPWREVADEFKLEADVPKGRPHSRRISYPTSDIDDVERTPLAQVRADLGTYYDEQLDRPPQPKVMHIIKGPPGLGKTYGLCTRLGQQGKKAILLTLENKLARLHTELISGGGGNARRMPVLRETACPSPDEYEATSRRGFKPSQSLPCRTCPIGPTHCEYLLGFSSLAKADQLCCAAIYHTHDDFYVSHGNQDRPIVVFDENCLDLLLEPVAQRMEQWREWDELLGRWEQAYDHENDDHAIALHRLVTWLGQTEKEFMAASDPDGEPAKFKLYRLPEELHAHDFTRRTSLAEWLDTVAHRRENRNVHNLYAAAVYLLREKDSYVLMERIRKKDHEIVNVRFRKKNPLPEDKEVFILDATANKELLHAIAPGWTIREWDCPPVEQAGRVVHVMDYDLSRNRIRREVEQHQPHNPSWLVQVLDHILDQHGPAHIISFKDVVDSPVPEIDILGMLKDQEKITGKHNFPCRGHTFEDKTLIVLGTPYKDQASLLELAMAIWGEAGVPKSDYTHRKRENGYFLSTNMEYGEPHLKPLQDFIVSADLVQAIGRVRPLQNDATVFVLSNAPVSDWDVEQFTASELFDMRQPLRRDAAEAYRQYEAKVRELLRTGASVSNSLVCASLELPERSGQRHWQRFLKEQAKGLQVENGRIRLPSGPLVID